MGFAWVVVVGMLLQLAVSVGELLSLIVSTLGPAVWSQELEMYSSPVGTTSVTRTL